MPTTTTKSFTDRYVFLHSVVDTKQAILFKIFPTVVYDMYFCSHVSSSVKYILNIAVIDCIRLGASCCFMK